MSEGPQSDPVAPRKRSPVPMAIVILGVLMMGVYWLTLGGTPALEGWGNDIDLGLQQGQRLGKPVLAFFSAPG